MALPDSDALVGLLPHRPPFRFVDVVDELTVAEHIVARYCVTGDEAFLRATFPGTRSSRVSSSSRRSRRRARSLLLGDERYAGKLPLFGGVEKVRFRRVVRPATSSCSWSRSSVSAPAAVGRRRALVEGDTDLRSAACSSRSVT